MAYLRHASRHVHHTVANYIADNLATLGWTVEGSVPFDSPVVKIWKSSAIIAGGLDRNVVPGTVAINLGNEPMSDPEELGGPLSSQEYPIFADVFQDKESTCLALANDIKDIVMGRLPGTRRGMPVINQMTALAEPGWWIELEDIERVKPESNFALHWQVVKVTATTYFNEVRY
jgi:hypothetical protein